MMVSFELGRTLGWLRRVWRMIGSSDSNVDQDAGDDDEERDEGKDEESDEKVRSRSGTGF